MLQSLREFKTPRGGTAVLFLLLVGGFAGLAKAETNAEKLGYPAGKKILILHADDLGMCYEANQSAKENLPAGHFQSGSAMVPCPWFNEFADWYKNHPDMDVGLHLSLTSEWKFYRWGPVSLKTDVPGLVDRDGYMHREVLGVVLAAKPEEVDKEIRAQIDRAIAKGIKPGHIDTHMGTLYARAEFTMAYLKAAVDYNIPAMVIEPSPKVIERYRKQGMPVTEKSVQMLKDYPLPRLDDFYPVPEGKTYEEKRENFFALVRSLDPGITELIFHPSVETECLKNITGSWQQRSWEHKMFADPVVKEFFQKEGILFTNWKEMMKRHEERKKSK
ncbi:MAG: polysaccharide deacetylase family protein [Planctomycetota bacterium]